MKIKLFSKNGILLIHEDCTLHLWSKERYCSDRDWQTWRLGFKPLWVYGWWWKLKLRGLTNR